MTLKCKTCGRNVEMDPEKDGLHGYATDDRDGQLLGLPQGRGEAYIICDDHIYDHEQKVSAAMQEDIKRSAVGNSEVMKRYVDYIAKHAE